MGEAEATYPQSCPKPLLIQDFKKMIEQEFGKDDFLEKYIYPVWCGIAKFSSKNTANYKNDLFIQALQIVIEEIYVRNHWWHSVRQNAIQAHNGEFAWMLEVAYEIVRVFPCNDEKKEQEKEIREQHEIQVQEIDRLYMDVKEYRQSNNFKKLTKFIKKFPYMAPYNAMLVYMQKPGSKFVASAREWERRYKRTPKTGARPLVMLKLFGPVSFMYELNDTEGKDFPENKIKPFSLNGRWNYKEHLIRLIENMRREGIGYSEENYGTDMSGFIDYKQGEDFVIKLKKTTKIVPHNFDVCVNINLSDMEKCITIFHELGHYFCGHFSYKFKKKYIPDRGAKIESVFVREFEAETVCWLLCERQGIKNPSAAYLSGYLDNYNEIPQNISLDCILKACGRIERMFHSLLPVRD